MQIRYCISIKTIVLLLFVLFAKSTTAQSIKESAKIGISNNDKQFGVIGKYYNRYFCYNAGKDIQVFVYDTSMVLINKIKLEFIPDNFRKIDFVPSANGILVLYQYFEENSVVIEGVLLDEEASLKEFPKKLWVTRLSNPNSINNFELANSEDKRNLVLYTLEKYKTSGKLHLLSVDNKLNIIDTLTYNIEENIKANEVDLSIDNNKVVSGVLAKKNVHEVYSNISYFISNKLKGITKTIPIDIENYFFNYKKIAVNNKTNKLHLLAYVNLKGDDDNAYIVHKTLDLQTAEAGVTKEILMVKQSNPKISNLDFLPQQIIFRNDDGMMVLSEYQNRHDVLVNTTANASQFNNTPIDVQRKVEEFSYGDIHVVNINKLEGVESENYIHKNQISEDDNALLSSYIMIKRPRNLSLIYNALDKDKSVYIADVTPDGNYVVNQFLKIYEFKTNFIFNKALQVGAKETLVPCFTKGNLSFARLLFN